MSVCSRGIREAAEPEIDLCWMELRKIFERPDVREAETKIMKALAEAFCPDPPPAPRPKKT